MHVEKPLSCTLSVDSLYIMTHKKARVTQDDSLKMTKINNRWKLSTAFPVLTRCSGVKYFLCVNSVNILSKMSTFMLPRGSPWAFSLHHTQAKMSHIPQTNRQIAMKCMFLPTNPKINTFRLTTGSKKN